MVPPTPAGLSDMAIFSPSRRGVAICDSPIQPAEGLASCSLASIVGWQRRSAPGGTPCRRPRNASSASAPLTRQKRLPHYRKYRKYRKIPSGPQCETSGERITSLAIVEFADARLQKLAALLGEIDQDLQFFPAVARE